MGRSLLVGTMLLVMGLAAGCAGESSSPSVAPAAAEATKAGAVAEVDVAALKAAREAGPVALVDVRTPEEFASGHVAGAVNIPVNQLAARLGELEAHRTSDLYLICRSGGRSAQAQSQLAAAGFTHPINVAGGTLAWTAAGNPVE